MHPNACQECVGFQTRAESPPAAGQCFEAQSVKTPTAPHVAKQSHFCKLLGNGGFGFALLVRSLCSTPVCKGRAGLIPQGAVGPPTPRLSMDLVERNSIHGGLGQCGCCSQAKQWPLAAIFQLNKYYHVVFPGLPCSCLL